MPRSSFPWPSAHEIVPEVGRVIRELEVDAPSPREEAFRTSAEYAAYCRQATEALQDAIGEAA